MMWSDAHFKLVSKWSEDGSNQLIAKTHVPYMVLRSAYNTLNRHPSAAPERLQRQEEH